MSLKSISITGVVLAGGQARRMGGGDKGLLRFAGKALVEYALAAIQPVVDAVIINANRNQDKYREYGFPVVADHSESFEGPLAGLLSAMQHADSEYLISLPCDCPLIDSKILERLIEAMKRDPVDCVVASDGERMHPVVLMLDCGLKQDLADYLARGERKIDRWFMRHRWKAVDFSDRPGVFRNINTPEELAALETEMRADKGSAC